MTQVANLNNSMGMPVRTAASKKEQRETLMEEFAGIMNQNTQNFLNPSADYPTGMEEMSEKLFSVNDAGDTSDVPRKNYEKLGSTGKPKITQAGTDRRDAPVLPEKVEKLAGDVKEAVQETMQVSGEDMEQAMAELGFGVMDLLQPQNLIQLVQKLTGSDDASILLTNESFQLTMQEVTGLITDFQQENGLNQVQFSDLLAQLSTEIDRLEEVVQNLLNAEDASQNGQIIPGENMMPEETVLTQGTSEGDGQIVSASGVTEQQNMTVQTTETEMSTTEEPVADQQVLMNAEASDEHPAQMTGGEESAESQGERNKQSFTTAARQTETVVDQQIGFFRESTMVANDQVPLQTAEVPQMQSYIQVEQLMEQMEGMARAFSSTEGTTLEMQLNPESLGKLVLTVTEKHGNLTAQITASNEQVKEALQTQMVELRSTLQAQGIKVEAVEVTVATHEFEQNLDGNSAADSQMQEQAGRQGTQRQGVRRNLNLNSLDELSGLMSEEEALAAQMMRDNGGTVDYTA